MVNIFQKGRGADALQKSVASIQSRNNQKHAPRLYSLAASD